MNNDELNMKLELIAEQIATLLAMEESTHLIQPVLDIIAEIISDK